MRIGDFIRLVLLLLLAVACMIFSLRNNFLEPVVSYLLFLPAFLGSLACVVRIIFGVVENHQQKKYVPVQLTDNHNAYSFRYPSIEAFERQLIMDGFDKENLLVSGCSVAWFLKTRKESSKMGYTWLNTQNIIITELSNNVDVKSLMREMDKQKSKIPLNSQQRLAQVHSSILCIVNDTFSQEAIADLLRQFNYIQQSVYLTAVLEKKSLKVYRSSVPDNKRTYNLHSLVNLYFS